MRDSENWSVGFSPGLTTPERTPLSEVDRSAAAEFWQHYLASVGGENEEGPADIACFDDSVELADELIALVLRGQKRATAGSLAEYEKSPMLGSVRMELSPVFGEDRDVVVLGSDLFGNPVVESGGKKGVGGAKGSDG